MQINLNEYRVRYCSCGSGLASWWEYDAKGIPLDRVCDKCVTRKLAKYRPEILTGYTQADVDEPIDEDY
jgi:hypothetical protein